MHQHPEVCRSLFEPKSSSSFHLFAGGDGPEAMTPALYDAAHKLAWRTNAVKIAILIADAPPHGLEKSGDHWPNGNRNRLKYTDRSFTFRSTEF